METVGRFQLLRRLGQGGTGIVYEARDSHTSGRVALKVLRHGDLTPLEKARFNREYSVLASLSHRNLVRVYEFGMDGRRPYYTMELLDGQTLAAVTASEDLPNERLWGDRNPFIFGVLLALLDAMEHLHRRGIVHRDIKPGNIMLTSGGVRLMDFGLARDGTAESVLTDPGVIVGTLRYSSPEQLDSVNVDQRADLYAFGVILYELSTGRPPFSGDGWPVVAQVLKDPVPPPIQFNSRLPAALAQLIMRLLEKRPIRRPQSVGKVRQLLLEIAKAAGVEVPQSDEQSRVRLPVAGNQVLFAPRYVAPAGMRSACQQFLAHLKGGHNGFFLAYGEEGMGKTRFAEELEQIAQEQNVHAVRSACEPGGAPYHAVAPLVQQVCQDMSADELVTRFGEAGRWLSRFLEQPSEEPRPADPHADKLKFFEAVSRVVRHAARQQPLVLIVDDIQWADVDNFELLSYIVRDQAYQPALGGPGVGLAWTCLGDAEPSLRERISRLTSGHVHNEYLLAPLLTADVLDLVSSMLEDDAAAEVLAPLLHREAAGNPTLVVDGLKRLVETGVLVERDGTWLPASTWEAVAAAVPASVKDSDQRRVEGLAESVMDVLRVAALLGISFSIQVLRPCAGRPETDVSAAVDELLSRQIFRAVPGRRQGQLAFVSPRLRRFVVDSLSFARRDRLERQIVYGLEGAWQAGDRRVLHALALHAVHAGDKDRSLQYVLLAAETAAHVLANQRAADLYQTAAGMEGFEWRLTPALRDAMFDVMMSAGRYAAAEQLARDSVAAEDDRSRQAHWQHRMGRSMMGLGKSDEALKYFTASLETLGFKTPTQGPALLGTLTWEFLRHLPRLGASGPATTPPPPDLTEALRVMLDIPNLYYFVRMPQRDLFFFNNILRAFNTVRQVGDLDMQALVYASYAFMLVMTARPPIALIRRFLYQATTYLPHLEQVAVRIEVCRYAGFSFYLLGDFAQARELVTACIELSEAANMARGVAEGHVVLAFIHKWTGPVGDLHRLAALGAGKCEALGETTFAVTGRMAQAWGLGLLQRYAEAEQVLVDAGIGLDPDGLAAEPLALRMGRAFLQHVQRNSAESAVQWEAVRKRWLQASMDHVQPYRFGLYAAMGYIRQWQSGAVKEVGPIQDKIRRWLRDADRLGPEIHYVHGHARMVEAQVQILQGAHAKGLGLATQGVAALQTAGAGLVEVDCRLALAETLFSVWEKGGPVMLRQKGEEHRRLALAKAEDLGALAFAAEARLLAVKVESVPPRASQREKQAARPAG